MDFKVDCPCGAQLSVSSADAGGTKRCRCGNINAVPSLSELRRQSGHHAYDVNIAEKLRYMCANGEIQKERTCLQCGMDTLNSLQLAVECERPIVKGRGFLATAILILFTPFMWVVSALSKEYLNPEVHGRELIVNIPLTLCPDCIADEGTSKDHLCDLLRRVPLYAQLLDEYPDADISIT